MVVLPAACWGSTETIDSTEVEQDEIHGTYRVTFDAARQSLRASAQFRVGGSTGTTVRLQSPSEVLFDDDGMTLRDGDEALINLVGTYYSLERSVPSPDAWYAYEYTDGDGRTWVNTIEVAERIAITSPSVGFEQSRSEDLVIEFDPPVGDGDESVSCWIFGPDSDDEDDDSAASERVTSGSTCIFTRSELSSFVDGSGHLEVRRMLQHDHQEGHREAGAEMTSWYESEWVQIELVP